MKIICYYNRNLKLTEGKLASQVGHVTKELGRKKSSNFEEDIIIVLKLSKTKFLEKIEDIKKSNKPFHIQTDMGLSEIPEGTITVIGYIDGDNN